MPQRILIEEKKTGREKERERKSEGEREGEKRVTTSLAVSEWSHVPLINYV